MNYTLPSALETLESLRDYLVSQGLIVKSNGLFLDRIIASVENRIKISTPETMPVLSRLKKQHKDSQ